MSGEQTPEVAAQVEIVNLLTVGLVGQPNSLGLSWNEAQEIAARVVALALKGWQLTRVGDEGAIEGGGDRMARRLAKRPAVQRLLRLCSQDRRTVHAGCRSRSPATLTSEPRRGAMSRPPRFHSDEHTADWVDTGFVVDTAPPENTYQCRSCGEVTHEPKTGLLCEIAHYFLPFERPKPPVSEPSR